MLRARRWAADHPSACAAVASLLLACVVVAVTPFLLAADGKAFHRGDVALLLTTFFVAQSCVLDIEFRRQSRSVSLSEIPFVLGLLFLGPLPFLLCRVGGGVLSQVLVRRQHRQPVKLAFNTALMAAEAAVGASVFAVVGSGVPVTAPRGWGAAVLGAVAANAFGVAAVDFLLSLIDTPRSARDLVDSVVSATPQATAVSSLAVLIVLSLQVSPWAALPVAGLLGILALSYRAYAELRARHDGLESLYRFSRQVANHPDTEQVMPTVLRQLREMLRAERAFLTVYDQQGGWEVSLSGTEAPARHPRRYVDAAFASATGLDGSAAEPVLMARQSADPMHLAWGQRVGCAEGVIVPLMSDASAFGAVGVADRFGDARGFSALDVQLLQTVATQVVSALKNGQLLDQLRHDALHDPLTQLPNREHMEQVLERLVAERAGGGPACTVALVGLGSFKEVNDNLGHQVGDIVLRSAAERLSASVRTGDLVARLGADQFVVLLPTTTTAQDGLAAVERLQAVLAQPLAVGDFTVDVGAAVAFLLVPEQATTAAQVLRNADQALTAARRSGREVLQFRPEHDLGLSHRLDLVAALRTALSEDRLEVFGQPKVDVLTGAVVGVEALSRWHDPVHGNVPPDVFVGLAERSGMIHALTAQVLEESIRSCQAWQQPMPGVGIAVNLSARSLLDRELLPLLDRLLAAHRLAPDLLTLEITESTVMSDSQASIQVLEQCRSRGIKLSVDDFGTGYSSLSYLRRLPVHEVKIDKSFILDVDNEVEDRMIVRSIIDLGHALSLDIVAEGVERPASLRVLRDLGCDAAQGYLIARPMPLSDLVGWSARYRLTEAVS
jgi:diguanylate cyclase (GGDEF)-like protein